MEAIDASACLAPLLAAGEPPDSVSLTDEDRRRFEERWRQLTDLGFVLEMRAHSLRIRHESAKFETVLQFGGPDDLAERRRLFSQLRFSFGTLRDRLPWLWQSSPAVTVPYEGLRVVLEVCEAVRRRRPGAR